MKGLFPVRAAARGMTLIELMVVVFILGLIATVVAINVRDAQVSAEMEAARTELATLRQALELYRLKKGRYPSTAEGLAALFSERVVAGKPKKDTWGNEYVYAFPSPGAPGEYELRSLGPDGQPGADDVE